MKGAGLLFYFMEFDSDSLFRGIVLPGLLIVDLALLAGIAAKNGLLGRGSDLSGGGFGGDGGGGDC